MFSSLIYVPAKDLSLDYGEHVFWVSITMINFSVCHILVHMYVASKNTATTNLSPLREKCQKKTFVLPSKIKQFSGVFHHFLGNSINPYSVIARLASTRFHLAKHSW